MMTFQSCHLSCLPSKISGLPNTLVSTPALFLFLLEHPRCPMLTMIAMPPPLAVAWPVFAEPWCSPVADPLPVPLPPVVVGSRAARVFAAGLVAVLLLEATESAAVPSRLHSFRNCPMKAKYLLSFALCMQCRANLVHLEIVVSARLLWSAMRVRWRSLQL